MQNLKLVHINHAQTMYAPFRTEDIHEYLSTYVGVICNHIVIFAGPVTLLALQGHFKLMQ